MGNDWSVFYGGGEAIEECPDKGFVPDWISSFIKPNNIEKRVSEHENEVHDGFSKKYHCNFLVFYEPHSDINSAISREKQIKSWRREKKNELIEKFNPKWEFLNTKILTI